MNGFELLYECALNSARVYDAFALFLCILKAAEISVKHCFKLTNRVS